MYTVYSTYIDFEIRPFLWRFLATSYIPACLIWSFKEPQESAAQFSQLDTCSQWQTQVTPLALESSHAPLGLGRSPERRAELFAACCGEDGLLGRAELAELLWQDVQVRNSVLKKKCSQFWGYLNLYGVFIHLQVKLFETGTKTRPSPGGAGKHGGWRTGQGAFWQTCLGSFGLCFTGDLMISDQICVELS